MRGRGDALPPAPLGFVATRPGGSGVLPGTPLLWGCWGARHSPGPAPLRLLSPSGGGGARAGWGGEGRGREGGGIMETGPNEPGKRAPLAALLARRAGGSSLPVACGESRHPRPDPSRPVRSRPVPRHGVGEAAEGADQRQPGPLLPGDPAGRRPPGAGEARPEQG